MAYENPLRWNLERLTLEKLISIVCLVGLLAFATILVALLVFLVVL
jgi:hypothetical protein